MLKVLENRFRASFLMLLLIKIAKCDIKQLYYFFCTFAL